MDVPGVIWSEATPQGIAGGIQEFVNTRNQLLDPAVVRRYA